MAGLRSNLESESETGTHAKIAPVNARAQFRAVAQMRWRMFLNSLRSRRGSFELGARIVMQGFFALIGLGVGVGLGFGAWQVASHTSLRYLAAFLWPVLIAWQFIPITIASFQENADLSIFLRFPLTFRSYAFFYILFGLFDIGSIVGGIALFGIWVGVSIARPGLIPWLTLALALFALFNIFLTRMIFAWIDRWLAQRKTREILGGIFLFLMLAAQLLNPALHQGGGYPGEIYRTKIGQRIETLKRVQSALPPGLTANAVAAAQEQKPFAAFADLLFLACFTAAGGSILAIRLRAEYRGENLGEAPSRTTKVTRSRARKNLLEGSGPIAAVIEKEIRYLMRSGVMLYGFLAPLIIVFLFSNGSHAGRANGFSGEYALPIGVAYGFLGLTRLIYNSLGAEGAGIQLYFMSPTPFRKVMLAKNITHTIIFVAELALVCVIVGLRVGMPDPQIVMLTFCWLAFAVPAQLAIGNILSITMAYRLNMTRMSREQGAAGNSLLGLLTELVVFAAGVAVYLPLRATGHTDLAAPILLALAAFSVLFWLRILSNSARMVENRKEMLINTVYRAV
jgi:ABC-2 type transport system permease protein